MKIYIACALRQRDRAKAFRKSIERFGHTSMSSWIDMPDDVDANLSDAECAAIATICDRDIEVADALVALLSDPVRGTLVEVGIARGLRKQIVCVGAFARPTLMLALPGVQWVETDANAVWTINQNLGET